MASRKRLNGVSHSIAHHAVSGLSWLHPHLRESCRLIGVNSMVVNLLATEPCPDELLEFTPLRGGIHSVKDRFEEILHSEGLSISDLKQAYLRFELEPNQDDYCCNCYSEIVSATGKSYAHFLNYLGKTISPHTSIRLNE